MAVTAMVYNSAVTSLANKEIDWGTDTIRTMLVDDTYSPNQVSHRYKSSITGEVSGTGYTTRGEILTNKTEAFVGQVKQFNADDVVWTNATLTAAGAVVYVDTGNDATSALICFVDFNANIPTVEGDFVVAWNSSGIFTATVATPV